MKGQAYVLRVVGSCAKLMRVREKDWPHEQHLVRLKAQTHSGVDFRARIGRGDWTPIDVGNSPTESRVRFVALSENPEIDIADRSLTSEPDLACTISEISVREDR